MGMLLEAVQSGDKRQILVALRDETAEAIEKTRSGRDFAALSKRLIEICDRMDALPNPDDTNPVDDMAALVKEFDGEPYDDDDDDEE